MRARRWLALLGLAVVVGLLVLAFWPRLRVVSQPCVGETGDCRRLR